MPSLHSTGKETKTQKVQMTSLGDTVAGWQTGIEPRLLRVQPVRFHSTTWPWKGSQGETALKERVFPT